MRVVDLILKKRCGETLTDKELEFLVSGYVAGSIPDYQMAALLMAVYFRGMTGGETASLTRCMLQSGRQLDLSSLDGSKIDKHSTGGVGDKVSLLIAPILAALGVTVPMMAGRGLGHTGGTLDKLEAIPGYRTSLGEQEFLEVLKKCCYAIIGQSEEIVPADKKLYALRDVTGTVESIPLITASIMSKKCAEGAGGFVFDVKCGSGAFMKNLQDANALAGGLVSLGEQLGLKTRAVITAMDQPLGLAVGNFLEVEEVCLALQNRGPADLLEVTLRLGGWMLVLAGKTEDPDSGMKLCRETLADGRAWQKFLENVTCQGGDLEVVQNPEKGPRGKYSLKFTAPRGGYISRLDACAVGLAAVMLGAGRACKEDVVSPGAGILLAQKCGDKIRAGQTLCRFFTDKQESLADAERLLARALTITDTPPDPCQLILAEL